MNAGSPRWPAGQAPAAQRMRRGLVSDSGYLRGARSGEASNGVALQQPAELRDAVARRTEPALRQHRKDVAFEKQEDTCAFLPFRADTPVHLASAIGTLVNDAGLGELKPLHALKERSAPIHLPDPPPDTPEGSHENDRRTR